MSGIDTRLAVYGTLAPGEPNHHQLADLRGIWQAGRVRGRLVGEGWGAAAGYPALVPDEAAGEIAVQLFTSNDLRAHWARLDAFEGDEYRRVAVNVAVGDERIMAWIYVAAA